MIETNKSEPTLWGNGEDDALGLQEREICDCNITFITEMIRVRTTYASVERPIATID